MGRPTDADHKDSSKTSGDETTRRGTRRRRRTLLNLGIPFVQVDDLLNQSEDAVALGYRVLEQTVEEIKNGYKEAQDFNRKREKYEADQNAYERGERTGPPPPPPEIPWTQLVTRAQNLQEFALQAVSDGSRIFFDSIRSGTDSMKSVASTWQRSRADVEAKPELAGPVIKEPIVITAKAGDEPERVVRRIRHRGLTRLRIHAEVDPPLKELIPVGTDTSLSGTLKVEKVAFLPETENDDEEFSVLTIDVGKIGTNQKPAEYEGLIRATNFELLIAKLRVSVAAAEAPTPSSQEKARATAAGRAARAARAAKVARAAIAARARKNYQARAAATTKPK